jgi:uncharacterized protein YukE
MTTLKVNPPVLQNVGTSFGQAAEELSGLQADAPLGDAAGSVAKLRTADACRKAQSDVAAATTAVAEETRKFDENLNTAARWYEHHDRAAAEAIKKIAIPK